MLRIFRESEKASSFRLSIDRITKFCYAELHTTQTKTTAADFLRHLIGAVPYKINKILTDNGIQFTNHDRHIYALPHIFDHIFDLICNENKIEHRTTQVKHPWTNGQVARMNRTLKEATVKTYYYDRHDQLKTHLHAYLMAYNFAKRLKALHGQTPWEFIQKEWEVSPEVFNFDPNQFFMGPNNPII